jgi:hypothetical protein
LPLHGWHSRVVVGLWRWRVCPMRGWWVGPGWWALDGVPRHRGGHVGWGVGGPRVGGCRSGGGGSCSSRVVHLDVLHRGWGPAGAVAG